MNNVSLTGRLTKDPEITTNEKGSYTRFSIAVNGRNKSVNFFTIVAFNKTAEIICKYLAKGSQIGVSGSLSSSTYKDKDQNSRTSVAVIANEVDFLDSKKTDTEDSSSTTNEFVEISNIDDDDLPF